MTIKSYYKLRSKHKSKTVNRAHILHDNQSYPGGTYGVAHVFGDSDDHANQTCDDLVLRYNLHDELVAALMDAHPHIADDKLRASIGNLITKARGKTILKRFVYSFTQEEA
jgi:hypothetical protein